MIGGLDLYGEREKSSSIVGSHFIRFWSSFVVLFVDFVDDSSDLDADLGRFI